MRLGVDFGTTNSSIALYDGDQLHTVVADPENDNPYVMPSLIYIDRQQQATVGAQAAETYLENETGRSVRWRQREAGEIEVTVASLTGVDPIRFMQTVNVMVDEAANGRLIQSIKTALFNPRYEGTTIFDRYYRIEELIAVILERLRLAAEAETGGSCTQIVLGRPVRFSTNPVVDSRAEAILLKAAHVAGFTDVVFEMEPVGVAYLYHRQSQAQQTVLVFDFGGGTLDLTVARLGGSRAPEILATGGVQIGGDDLDRRIMASLLPHFGGGDDGVLSSEMSDKLLAWQTMPELSRPRYIEQILRLKRNGHAEPMEALESLISHNVGFKLFKEIERVKKQLSTDQSAVIEFDFESINIREPISRRRFNRLIARDLDEIVRSIHAIIEDAQLTPKDIDVVLRTGGSSLVPAIRQLLASIFGEPRMRSVDPLISVTGGFAVVAHELNQSPPPPPIAPDQLMPHVRTQGTTDYGVYTITIDAKVYQDRDFVVNRIPPALNRLPAIRTANDDNGATDTAFLEFTLTAPARVYVTFETTAHHIPRWLRAFEPEKYQIEIEDRFALIKRSHQVYSKNFPAGPVILGGNQAAGYDGDVITHYLVIVDPLD